MRTVLIHPTFFFFFSRYLFVWWCLPMENSSSKWGTSIVINILFQFDEQPHSLIWTYKQQVKSTSLLQFYYFHQNFWERKQLTDLIFFFGLRILNSIRLLQSSPYLFISTTIASLFTFLHFRSSSLSSSYSHLIRCNNYSSRLLITHHLQILWISDFKMVWLYRLIAWSNF